MSDIPDFFFTIQQPAFAEYKDRGSKFLAYAYPLNSKDEVKTYLSILKKEHGKAVHHCFAYRLGLDKTEFRVSDDGEPSGTAGRPILGQIDSRRLTNILIIVVRYFGGTLLGVPGLINAYKSAAALALQMVPIVQSPVLVQYEVHFNYTAMNEVMMIIKNYNCTIFNQDTQLFCYMKIGVPKARMNEVLFKMNDLTGVEINKS
ncbi:MAG: YigZ family protein [Bacteroidota bacterium]|jgi:uncharacterized YigZ family protein|nr:YigZ family protein [Bacteroidota bacterium]